MRKSANADDCVVTGQHRIGACRPPASNEEKIADSEYEEGELRGHSDYQRNHGA